MEKKFIIFYAWIGSLVAVAFYSHEFAYMDGMRDQRQIDANTLISCQKTLAGNMYAK